jgi:hypothetical protein
MKNILDLSGKKFSMITVVSFAGKGPGGRKWNCICDCGSNFVAYAGQINNGRKKSCGCKFKSPNRKAVAMRAAFRQYKKNNDKRGLEFEITEEIFTRLTSQPCFYCGQEPSNTSKTQSGDGKFVYNGIDRMDSSVGYTLKNCVPCCGPCNRAKFDMSFDEFIVYLNKLVACRIEMMMAFQGFLK